MKQDGLLPVVELLDTEQDFVLASGLVFFDQIVQMGPMNFFKDSNCFDISQNMACISSSKG